MKRTGLLLALILLLLTRPSLSPAEVLAHDLVAVRGEEVMLRAETRGAIFSRGGEVVHFFVDGKSVGKNLSGGDGVALKPFRAEKAGLREVRVQSGRDEDEGLLLTLPKGSDIVFVDVEIALFAQGAPGKAKPGSREALKGISKRRPVVLLQSGYLGVKALRLWLRENEYPRLPVLPWNGGAVFDETARKGLGIGAVVGGPHIVESAKKHRPAAYCFDRCPGAEKVRGWEDLGKKIR